MKLNEIIQMEGITPPMYVGTEKYIPFPTDSSESKTSKKQKKKKLPTTDTAEEDNINQIWHMGNADAS